MKLKQCSVCNQFVPLWRSSPPTCKSCMPRTPIKPKVGDTIGTMQIKSITKSDSQPIRIVMTPNKPRTEPKKPKGEVSIPELLKLATIAFNRWIKKRDRTDTLGGICISCGEYKLNAYLQAGHYMPSTYSSLKFNELNVNSECERCNCGDDTHLIGYRNNLIKKIGIDKVLWLEETPLAKTHKWTREELNDIIQKYK